MTTEKKDDIIYIQCEKSIKNEFYRIAKEKGVSPTSLIRAFMKKVVNTHSKKSS